MAPASITIFAKRAVSVEKMLVYPWLQGRQQAGHDLSDLMLQVLLKTLGCDEIVRQKERGSLAACRNGDRETSSGCGCAVHAPETCPEGAAECDGRR